MKLTTVSKYAPMLTDFRDESSMSILKYVIVSGKAFDHVLFDALTMCVIPKSDSCCETMATVMSDKYKESSMIMEQRSDADWTAGITSVFDMVAGLVSAFFTTDHFDMFR